MNLDTISLQCFIAVAETGSFTKAADMVGRTQSAVSQQVAKLENALSTSLFSRGKQMYLTTEGQVFLGYARRIYAAQREVLDRFKEPELEGKISFGLPEDFASVLLSEVLVAFSRDHPRVVLNVECDLTLNLYDRFRKGDFDLVLVKMSQPEDFPNGVEVLSEKLVWVAEQSILSDLSSHEVIPLILSPPPCVYRTRAIEALEHAGRKWNVIYASASYAGAVAAVKAGLGLTILPKNLVPENLRVVDNGMLPDLKDTHISLIVRPGAAKPIINFANEVLKRLQRM